MTPASRASAESSRPSSPPAPPRPPRDEVGGLRLPRTPGFFRRFLARHPLLVDIAIAFACFLLVLLGGLEGTDDGIGFSHGPYYLVIGFVASAALVFRRSRPISVTVFEALVTAMLSTVDVRVIPLALVVAVYSIAVYRSTAAAWITAGALTVAVAATMFFTPVFVEGNSGLVVGLVLVILIGQSVGGRRRYLGALIDLAAQLARERDQQAQLATAAERARIAREMHDVVAHGLSVMIRLSDGADAVAESDPARAQEAVRQIGAVGRDSLRDMRRLLGVLRDDTAGGTADDAPRAPQPTLDELDDLLETYRAAGLPVVVRRTGTPPTSDAVQVVVYRAVQEALTNCLRYASRPSRVLVSLTYGGAGAGAGVGAAAASAEDVVVEVTDDGATASTPAESVGTERGLVGLRERAALFGGSLLAGPRLDGPGWRVRLVLPGAANVSAPAAGRAPAAGPAPAADPAPETSPAPAADPAPAPPLEGDS